MPKVIKFVYEIYDENNDFIDELTFTRSEAKKYLEKHPDYTMSIIDSEKNMLN